MMAIPMIIFLFMIYKFIRLLTYIQKLYQNYRGVNIGKSLVRGKKKYGLIKPYFSLLRLVADVRTRVML